MLKLPILAICLAIIRSGPVSGAAVSTEAIIENGDISLKHCDLTKNCDLDIRINTGKKDPDVGDYYDSLGLYHYNLRVNRIAIGFAPGFKEAKSANTPAQINLALPRPMSIVGDYLSINWDNLDRWPELGWHYDIIKRLDGNPVWTIGLMSNYGLDIITEATAVKIAMHLRGINIKGTTVWLRPFYEMNGDWNAWGQRPEKFVRKWRILADAIKQHAPKTLMLWSPNVAFGHSVDDKKGYSLYWPGPEYVSLCGISFYHWGENYHRVNKDPELNSVTKKLYEFARIYGEGNNPKPIIISETAASFTYEKDTNIPIGSASQFDIKLKWLHLLLDPYLKLALPCLKALIWFEMVKDENATGNTPVRTEDFRLVTGAPPVRWGAVQYFKNSMSLSIS